MSLHRQDSIWGLGFLVLGLVLLFIGVRGLLGLTIILPTRSRGLQHLVGRSARVGGGVALFYAVIVLGFAYSMLR